MPSPFERQANDLGVHSIPPSRPGDPRVRLAEEDSLQAQITAWMIAQSKKSEWATEVEIAIDAVRRLNIAGTYRSVIHPSVNLSFNTKAMLPAIEGSSTIVKKEEILYLILFAAIVGGEHDIGLGQVSFQYLDRQNGTLTPVQKENAKRDRVYWLLVLASEPLSSTDFNDLLPTELLSDQQSARLTGDRYLPVTDTTEGGFALGSLRIYASDPNIVAGNYPVIKDLIEVAPICRVLRVQNYTDRGYTWGRGGEEPLTRKYSILPLAFPPRDSIDSTIRQRLVELFSGSPGIEGVFDRTIQNLTAGLVGGNPGRAGESAASPNNSVCLSNGDRVTFTNQAFLQKLGVQVVTAANDGSGNAVVSAQLNTNSPSGSLFSEKGADHKIYKSDGTEQSGFGRFINLGGTGSLTWIGTQNSGLRPGQECYFVPAIKYPAGSGFTIPFNEAEQVWMNGVALAPANILAAEVNDLVAYAAPTSPFPPGTQGFWVGVGKERAAFHYIYKRVSVQTDSNGVAIIPVGERGCFAFIEGVEGRIDSPVKTGLEQNTTYNALVYYPPRATESWQFQLSYLPYQGTGEAEPTWLTGAVVISKTYAFMTTQGGGTSVYQGNAQIRFSPVAMHLPQVDLGLPIYDLDAPLRFVGEPNPGPITFREIEALPGAGLALPTPGMVLSLASNTGLGSGQSLHAALSSNTQPLGFRTPILNKRVTYQAILAFLVRKAGVYRLVIATHTGRGGEDVRLDSSQGTAFDTFLIEG